MQITNVFSPSQDEQARRGVDVLVEALQREGVTHVFGYPGDASMEILEAPRLCKTIINVLARHKQGSIFAAEGYARALGVSGVCITIFGPGATNIMPGLANAYSDSVPLVAITGQLKSHLMSTDAFQDTPIVELTRPITKHNYLVLDVEDIPRIVKEAQIRMRPDPVLIDIPKDIQLRMMVPHWDQPMRLDRYLSRFIPPPPRGMLLEKIVGMIYEAKSPVVCMGGGCLDSSDELRRFVQLTGIPVTSTMMGLVCYPCDDEEFSLQMLGLYGKYRATANLETFASRAKTVHIDIDPTRIGKKKQADVSLCADIKSMGFGLPAAIGAAITRPNTIVIDIDGDGSFLMNVQELATAPTENLFLKMMIFNNQHLGMVAEWEDRLYKSNRAHSYLENILKSSCIFPDMLKFAEACDITAARVTMKNCLRVAIQKMLDTLGPYLLDVIIPSDEHALRSISKSS
ncbi:hypothetical protein BUALT_Bualt02G0182200 [Buddleja alternifolia]|uniref:Acetolactate synthase n=1 Tax=Buddleja alternifolia TaxID=168488 RepID=A0AAV6Y2P8_9LAMI|nr:hypothetical protein BUALT_Bualt02G0182200 [Buddleja alternifolia]